MTNGISNAAESTISFVIVDEQTEEFGEGQVYGWIELDGFKVEWDSSGDDETDEGALDVSVGSVTGKVMLGAAYISLDEATVAANEANAFALINQQLVPYVAAASADVGTKYMPEFPGVALGFAVPDVATIEFGVASRHDWVQDTTTSTTTAVDYDTWVVVPGLAIDEDDDGDVDKDDYAEYVADRTTSTKSGANDANAWVMSIDAAITAVDNVTIALVSTMQFGTPNGDDIDSTPGSSGNPAGIGFSAEYAMPMGDMTFSPVFGADVVFEEDASEDLLTTMEFGLGGKLSWASLGLDEDEDDHIDFVGNADDEEEVTSGVYLGGIFGIHPQDKDEAINTLGARFGLYEDGGDDGLLPVIGGALMVDYMTLLENEDAGVAEARSDLGIGAEVNAGLGVVSPYAGIKVLMLDVEGNTLQNPKTLVRRNPVVLRRSTLGTDINVIANTTFTLDYASGNLLYNDDYYGGADPTYGDTYGNISSSTAKLGVVSLQTKVAF